MTISGRTAAIEQRRRIEHVDHNGCGARGLKPSGFAPWRVPKTSYPASRNSGTSLANRSGRTSEKNFALHKMSSCENKMLCSRSLSGYFAAESYAPQIKRL